ncbi:glycosyl transferase family 1 [Pontibacter mucosus]|uniref:Glycosyl transferase family 1 n=1 Tax=Pontibacter mucosus TaxID=1649266 RepID=A0A2T5YQ81_9BACT|nr:glycosyltransferase family 4 protein [Pontibacter mucosus]PTX21467.1 glycosyl transferase family 1 [Pontibacter mucosus]
MSVLLLHPTGNANVRAAANGLAGANLLKEFHTSVASFPGGILDGLGSISAFSEIRRRRFGTPLKQLTKTYPWREIGRIASAKVGFSSLIKHESGVFSVDNVYRSLDRRVALRLKQSKAKGINSIYAYEDGAAYSFREAKKHGVQCFYDLPTGYWRSAKRLLQTEREQRPEWSDTLSGFQDSDAKLSRKDEELRMADIIIVASKFTAETLRDYPGELAPVKIIPYGFPLVNPYRDYSNLSINRPLKLLFVGKLTQQKGIANLFAAVDALKDQVTLTLVGRKASNDNSILNKALAKHNWIPSLSHHEVLKLMLDHDVLVFPSLFDGFGLVITEAMAQGTPVIATERSAGPDLIQHGKNGWLVDSSSTGSLQKVIEELLECPELVAKAGIEAMKTAKARPWEAYEKELVATVRERLSAAG